ncbi:hypothetical protein J6590_063116 [Homalodisca vitripennis]|nr:hypothetical protein J6590_063116 [Homalodisca vitripennis]
MQDLLASSNLSQLVKSPTQVNPISGRHSLLVVIMTDIVDEDDRSTCEALTICIHVVTGLEGRQGTLRIMMGLTEASDCISHDRLMESLQHKVLKMRY